MCASCVAEESVSSRAHAPFDCHREVKMQSSARRAPLLLLLAFSPRTRNLLDTPGPLSTSFARCHPRHVCLSRNCCCRFHCVLAVLFFFSLPQLCCHCSFWRRRRRRSNSHGGNSTPVAVAVVVGGGARSVCVCTSGS